MRCRYRRLTGIAATLPAVAEAHTPIEGLGDFYNGMLHPLVVPAHLLALLGVGLLIGRQPPAALQPAALGFLAATTLGLLGAGLGWSLSAETPLLAGAAICGLLLAWGSPLPAWLGSVSGIALGFAIGTDSGQGISETQAVAAALTGTGVSVYLLFLYALATADSLRKRHWQQVAVRVAGSWIAASSILVLALTVIQPA
jgi:hydrogenase/urease accessory protein HupE